MPAYDEIIGSYQLKELCQNRIVFWVDEEKIKGKTVMLFIDSSTVVNTIVPISYFHYSYRDATTNEEYMKYDNYYLGKGWIAQTFFGSSTSFFVDGDNESRCQVPVGSGVLSETYHFNLIRKTK